MIYGNLDKIKKFDIQELSKLVNIHFEDIVDYDFLILLSDYVKKYQMDVGFYLNNDNKLQYIFFGTYDDLPLDNAESFDIPEGRLFVITYGVSKIMV